MSRFIAIILVSVFALTGNVNAGVQKPKCRTACEDYKTAHPKGRLHVEIPLVCIHFRQDGVDNVVMSLYDSAGKFREYAKTAQPVDEFCIGRNWLTQAVKIEFCNGVRTEVLSPKHIAVLRRSGMPQGSYACLYGNGKCNTLTKVL